MSRARSLSVRPAGLVVALLAAGLAPAATAVARPVSIFVADSFAELSAGTREAVSVDPLGTLQLARRVEPLAKLEEPFVFSAAGDRDGWIVGTGSSGRVLRVGTDGSVRELMAAPEPQIFAVLADDGDGSVLAASSPDGKVYRVAEDGAVSTLFDPPESYVWALARDPKGDLLVATGLEGRLYRVGRDGRSEVLLEAPDRHLRSLAVLPDGAILAGTAGEGRILRIDPRGAVSTVHDSALPEVVSLVARPDGGAYAVVLASEASLLDLSGRPPASLQAEGVTVVIQEATAGSRPGGATGPRSLVLEISPGGEVEELGRFDDRTIHSALLVDDELWLGTGEEGELFRYGDRRLVVEKRLEERQIPALAAGPAGAAVLTANAAALYRLGRALEKEGVYTSTVLDAGQPARFGSLRREGEEPVPTAVSAAVRSGMSQEPDDTWTDWLAVAKGEEGSLAALSPGRFFQWRATLRGDGERTPVLSRVEVSYRQENQRPAIASFELLDPGQILVPQGFNPGNQVYEPWSPNKEGIFTTLAPPQEDDTANLKALWKRGYRTARWKASDPNGDALRFKLEVRPDPRGDAAGEDGPWLEIADGVTDSTLSFDASVLPDGRYRFRLTASDREARPAAEALAVEEESETVIHDLTPPRLAAAVRRGDTIHVELADQSPLTDVAVSVDAAAWEEVVSADGLLDGRREALAVPVPEGARVLLLRATDAASNVATFDLLAAASR